MLKVPAWLRTVVYSCSSLLFGVIMGFFSKEEWIKIYKSKLLPHLNIPLALILLPIVLLLNTTLTAIALIEMINQGITIKGIAALIVEVFKTTQTVLAIISIATISAVSSIVVSAVLVAAMSLEALFNVVCFFSHLRNYYYAATPQEQHENKMLAGKYGFSALAGILLVIGIGITVLSGFAAPVIFPIGIITAFIASIVSIAAVIFSYYAEKKSKEPQLVPPVSLAPVRRPLLSDFNTESVLESLRSDNDVLPEQRIISLDASDDLLDRDSDGNGMLETFNKSPLPIKHSTIFHHFSTTHTRTAAKSPLQTNSFH